MHCLKWKKIWTLLSYIFPLFYFYISQSQTQEWGPSSAPAEIMFFICRLKSLRWHNKSIVTNRIIWGIVHITKTTLSVNCGCCLNNGFWIFTNNYCQSTCSTFFSNLKKGWSSVITAPMFTHYLIFYTLVDFNSGRKIQFYLKEKVERSLVQCLTY